MNKSTIIVFASLFLSATLFFRCSTKNIEKHDSKLYKPDSSSGLKISLAKDDFKIYEPILVRIDYINKHIYTDTIYYNFVETLDYSLKFYIVSENNDKYFKVIHYSPLDVFITPQYFIEPGDTISVTMNLTYKYGDTIPCEQRPFCYFGYLKPRKYKFYAYDLIGGEEISSNELSFNVMELSEQDKKVLDLIKNKNYDLIFNSFPMNSFTEHVYVYYFGDEMYPMETYDNDNDSISKTFFNFVKSYPNSLYNMNMGFVFSYFAKITNKTHDIIAAMDDVKRNTGESLFKKFIENKYIKEKLIKNYRDLKNILNKSKINK